MTSRTPEQIRGDIHVALVGMDQCARVLDLVQELETAARSRAIDDTADLVENTDDKRCGQSDCCGLHSDDFAEEIRKMKKEN